jgi:acetyl esterase/lipase
LIFSAITLKAPQIIHVINRLFQTLILGIAWIQWNIHAAEEPSPSRIVPYKQVGSSSLYLHVFNPKGHSIQDRTPAIVFFFGGGWNGGTPKQFYPQSAYLATRGMVAICAEYRTKSSHQTTPKACVKDGKSAMRWVRYHANDLGIDPNKIAAGGGSAGGHVAATTATIKSFDAPLDPEVDAAPQALVLFNPVYDNGPDGYGHDRVKDYWKKFSPMHNLHDDVPPTIVFLGTKDKLIPVKTGQSFQSRMQRLNLRSELVLYEKEGHGFFNKNKFNETLFETDRFLTSLGFLKEDPTIEAAHR